MSEAKFVVGIDLGTSNCAVAYADVSEGGGSAVQDFAVPQLVAAGEVRPLPLLPSCAYIPTEHERASGTLAPPWSSQTDAIVGEFARWQGTRVPGRLISSAKSWLCHGGVDRTAPILPWGAPSDVRKLSPVETSSLFLQHIREAWDAAHPDPADALASQEVVVTVPASFDEVARSLTVGAVRRAGLEKFTLLEEPQAAFYDFTAVHRQGLAQALEGVRLVLVVDVGGGTSDFTLVQTGEGEDGPTLRRIAVGDHLILGGDNMDAALGRKAEERMVQAPARLSGAQWSQLLQTARNAKEQLLAGTAEYNVSVAAEGSKLFGRALSARISKEEAATVVLDGFFPFCRPDEMPRKGPRLALQEMSLPYAEDPAITRHLAGFLRAHAELAWKALGQEPVPGVLPRPDALLLNGGVFNSPVIAERLLEVLCSWWTQQPKLKLLRHGSLDLSVARGAAYYGLVRRGLGRRITGGAAHALYVGLEKAGSSEPMALCVIPRGQEEGERVELGGTTFQLALGRPVKFPLYSTAADRLEKPGDVVDLSEDMNALPPIHSLLKGAQGLSGNVPVHLQAMLTEIGTLELWCAAAGRNERWRLEFELRGGSDEPAWGVTESMPAGYAVAKGLVEGVFGKKPSKQAGDKGVKQIWGALERALGPRETWRVPVLREMWAVLFGGAQKRRRSADHERIYYQLLGYTLRPGFGYPLDEWRCEQVAGLFAAGIEFHKEKPNWNEFWVFWRRIAGGLSEQRHSEIWGYIKPYLGSRVPMRPVNLPRSKGVQPEAYDEMLRLGASLEHLDPAEKTELGEWVAQRLLSEAASGPWAWALGRLGARALVYGSAHKTVSPDRAERWIELLLKPEVLGLEGATFALAQLARRTGDRVRDVSESTRKTVLTALEQQDASPTWIQGLREVRALEAVDKARALGDSIPAGLSLP